MWPWEKEYIKGEAENILNGFPIKMRKEVQKVFDIIPQSHDITCRFKKVIRVDTLIHPDKQIVRLDEEILVIPSRIYFNEPQEDKENELTALEQSILNCIYLRHHNGIVRQKRLSLLLGKDDYFIIPYKFHLLGEYVIEILEDLRKHINDNSIDNFVKLARENEQYFVKTESKMAGSWNTHYRWKFRKLKNYIGRQNIDSIKKRMSIGPDRITG